MIWCIKTYTIAYVKKTKNEEILSIMSNLQPNCCLKVDFQKVEQDAGGKWLIHDTKRRKDNQLHSVISMKQSWFCAHNFRWLVSSIFPRL